MTPAELAAYSYTAATGKRPQDNDGWVWYECITASSADEPDTLQYEIFGRMEGGKESRWGWKTNPTEAAALAAADAAADRAGWRPDGEEG